MISGQLLAEFIGTAIFLTIILKSGGDKYVVSLGLLAAILIMGNVSGGHFNPAVSVMEMSRGNLNYQETTGYILAQLLGALVATRLALISNTSKL
jgi:glycerol uptake facilitator-like aquaporin